MNREKVAYIFLIFLLFIYSIYITSIHFTNQKYQDNKLYLNNTPNLVSDLSANDFSSEEII